MDIKQLSIGDFLWVDKKSKKFTKVRAIPSIDSGTILLDEYDNEQDIENFESIEITLEFLAANGFDDKYYHHKVVDGIDIEICVVPDIPMYVETLMWHYVFPHITYVHELQHVLRMLGLYDFADNLVIC